MAPMGAAGTLPISIISTSPQRSRFSVSERGTKSSGRDTAAHPAATLRGLSLFRSANRAPPLPRMSPLFTMRIAA